MTRRKNKSEQEMMILTLRFCLKEPHMISEMEWIAYWDRMHLKIEEYLDKGLLSCSMTTSGRKVALYRTTRDGELVLRTYDVGNRISSGNSDMSEDQKDILKLALDYADNPDNREIFDRIRE